MAVMAGAAPAAGGTRADESVDQVTKSALALDADPQRGAGVYAQNCARCHGRQAQGDATKAIPVLAGQRFAYLVRQLANFAGEERDSTTMHRIVSQASLGAPQTWVDVAAWLNAAPRLPAATPGPGTDVALGRGIFHEQCAGCHHADARGDDQGFVPSLRNQHYAYLRAQMQKIGADYRHNVDENLVRFLASFDARDIDATADYLARLHGPGKDRRQMRSNGVAVD
jgi:cytochrome c553